MQAALGLQKEGHGPRHSMRREWKLGKRNALNWKESRVIYKNVDYFRIGAVHELYSLKACQISKVQARAREITNEPCSSSNNKNSD